jgi:hypothetical protein
MPSDVEAQRRGIASHMHVYMWRRRVKFACLCRSQRRSRMQSMLCAMICACGHGLCVRES